jgi:ankyrin repeat protein
MKKTLTLLSLFTLLSLPIFAQNIFTAIQENDIPAVKYLLEKGVNVIAKDEQGNSPLINAVKNNHDRAVLLLLQRNPDVDVKDNGGNTPLILAASTKNIRITDLLLTHYPKLDVKNNTGATALITAVQAGNNQVAETLVRNGANAKTTDKQHKAAIDYAKEMNNTKAITFLSGNTTAALGGGQ